jgi:DNA-binding NtrC family response regulator
VVCEKLIAVIGGDEPATVGSLESQLNQLGFDVHTAPDVSNLCASIRSWTPSVILLDMEFVGTHCFDVRREFPAAQTRAPVVFFSMSGSTETVVQAIKMGADDFLTWPMDIDRLRSLLQRAIEKDDTNRRVRNDTRESNSSLLGLSPAITNVRMTIKQVAPTDATVLVLGESGTGKEIVAREIHRRSHRARNKFVAINMAALPAHLLESTLFGRVRGAFTGADTTQGGLCHEADQGTLLLDEISEMDLGLQPKLLRFLQEGTLRVGSNRVEKVDVRIISASNRDLKQAIREGRFREDLYFRLNVVPIEMPPLRERREDIELLADFFLHQAARRYRTMPHRFTPGALNCLFRYDWPGNIRQLENFVHRMVVFAAQDEITEADLPREIAQSRRSVAEQSSCYTSIPSTTRGASVMTTVKDAEKRLILDALAKTDGNVVQAAGILGLGQATVYRKLKRYGITRK